MTSEKDLSQYQSVIGSYIRDMERIMNEAHKIRYAIYKSEIMREHCSSLARHTIDTYLDVADLMLVHAHAVLYNEGKKSDVEDVA